MSSSFQHDITLLFQDLLSPPSSSLSPHTPALLSYHITSQPLTPASSLSVLSSLFHYLTISPSLWSKLLLSNSAPGGFESAQTIYHAILHGVDSRIDAITHIHGVGYFGKRQLGAFLEGLYSGIWREEVVGGEVPVLVTSAVLKALQARRARRAQEKEGMDVGKAWCIGRAEKEVMKAWERCLTRTSLLSAMRSGWGEDSADLFVGC